MDDPASALGMIQPTTTVEVASRIGTTEMVVAAGIMALTIKVKVAAVTTIKEGIITIKELEDTMTIEEADGVLAHAEEAEVGHHFAVVAVAGTEEVTMTIEEEAGGVEVVVDTVAVATEEARVDAEAEDAIRQRLQCRQLI